MAVDTAIKRFSMLGFGSPAIKHVIPSGSVNAAGRSTLMDLYAGIASGAPSGGWSVQTDNSDSWSVQSDNSDSWSVQ